MTGGVPECLAAALRRLGPLGDCWVAFSGGTDSTALLHAAATRPVHASGTLRAIHIDHGLHADSPCWAEHCRRICDALGVPLAVRRLNLTPIPGESLEATAREARYRALAEVLRPGDLMLTAHNQDDQAETLLLALLRGSGVHGLAAMPREAELGRGRLVRPLLDVPRATLEQYVRSFGLSWIEDPSNTSLRMDRNYLRNSIVPLLRARWPGLSATLSRSAGHCAEAAQLVDGLAAELMGACAGSHPGTLGIGALGALERSRRKAVLRLWLRRRGFALPDRRHLARILDEVIPARADADPLVAWFGCEVRRYRDDLFALAPLPPPPGALTIRQAPSGMPPVLELPAGLGWLQWEDMSDGSESAPTVRFGSTGLTCRSRSTSRRRTLKNLFQEAGIPRWLRPYVPLVFSGDILIAVAGVCGCHDESQDPATHEGPQWLGHPWEGLALFRHRAEWPPRPTSLS
ncbi:tRNA lysidine(34) synthetase TilS [Thiocapsa roseopersicina]|uniref:tRNA(Ile)-lysidine synthase n=1 Tax=Thiocapsa roseopersicina TaxID=1058 RepID=A0A1H2XMJ4_THIRO|nr:tRNA lysidine(34) synthetase TilS [Thiocapsa roseopersicina]SDW93509.1 tRNA(Ile)-lysidine synthase [Thiocapsa roseopersicina]